MGKKITISGAGCCLVDQIYPDIDFSEPAVTKYMSQIKGDGGLYPGRLVFSEQFEGFANSDLQSVVNEISVNRMEPTLNVGGPSIVALIHASQLLQSSAAEVRFYGARGDDKAGQFLQSKLEETPVRIEQFRIAEGATPSTTVLSDPTFNKGRGERIFINDIGASWHMGADDLTENFFKSDIVVFGGTALVPGLHDALADLLIQSKSEGCMTVVNTVYDFRNEFKNPGKNWPLGENNKTYMYIDMLIMDREEALHLSGKEDLSEAGEYFIRHGVKSYIITNGTEKTHCYSDGSLFISSFHPSYPVSDSLVKDLKGFKGGDTTGCGDNFVGGVLASLGWQMQKDIEKPDLADCISWGTVFGGYCCFHVGGTYIEKKEGEKLKLIKPYLDQYKKKISG